MSKEQNAIEKILDENNNENVVLYDEKNNETEFEQVAIIPLEDKLYTILKPVKEMEGVAEDEAIVFEFTEDENEDEILVVCEDDKTIDKVFDEYYRLLKEAGVDVDEELKDEE